VPVVKISGRAIGSGKVGPVTAKIFEEFAKVRHSASEGTAIYPENSPRRSL
jgi:hypothetical protein